jgi:hypothetical protein
MVPTGEPHPPELRRSLQEAYGNTRQSERIARNARTYWRTRVNFTVSRAWWPWPGGPVADALTAGNRPDLVECLASGAFRQSSLILGHVTQRAWDAAFDDYSDGGV